MSVRSGAGIDLALIDWSVDWWADFTRQCNYKCGFCFHTQTNKEVLPLEEAKRGLRMLAESGM
jgi:2-iminoacetate synthase ThiH